MIQKYRNHQVALVEISRFGQDKAVYLDATQISFADPENNEDTAFIEELAVSLAEAHKTKVIKIKHSPCKDWSWKQVRLSLIKNNMLLEFKDHTEEINSFARKLLSRKDKSSKLGADIYLEAEYVIGLTTPQKTGQEEFDIKFTTLKNDKNIISQDISVKANSFNDAIKKTFDTFNNREGEIISVSCQNTEFSSANKKKHSNSYLLNEKQGVLTNIEIGSLSLEITPNELGVHLHVKNSNDTKLNKETFLSYNTQD